MASHNVKVPAFDIELFHGRHKRLNITVRDHLNRIVDLSGSTVEFAMSKIAGGKVLVSKVGILTDPANGKCQVDILDTDTDLLPNAPGLYYHECVVTDGAGRESTIFYGTAEVKASTVQT